MKFKAKAQAKTLTHSQMKKVLSRCELMPSPECKKAVMVLSWSTIRVTEISQLTVDDLMFPNGKIKQEVSLRAAICKRHKNRTVWISSTAIQVLQTWFDFRKVMKWGTTFNKELYQGLNPSSAAIFNNRGRRYSLKRKTRINKENQQVDYLCCDALELEIRRIYGRCGLHGYSSHSGRRTQATTLNRNGVPLSQIQRILGHNSPTHSLRYIDIDSEQLTRAAELAF